MRRLKFIALALVIAGLGASLVIFGVVRPFTPSAPAAWHQVHVGMQRSNILELIGAAQAGMFPEKILEIWSRDGTLGIRKMEVWYQNYGDERATMVAEYVYWRPSQRYIFTRKEP